MGPASAGVRAGIGYGELLVTWPGLRENRPYKGWLGLYTHDPAVVVQFRRGVGADSLSAFPHPGHCLRCQTIAVPFRFCWRGAPLLFPGSRFGPGSALLVEVT